MQEIIYIVSVVYVGPVSLPGGHLSKRGQPFSVFAVGLNVRIIPEND
jgi:hypothetical protein